MGSTTPNLSTAAPLLERKHGPIQGLTEHIVPQPRLPGQQIRECGEEREAWLQKGGVKGAPDDPVRRHSVKRVSALFSLPYWSVSFLMPLSRILLKIILHFF